MSEAPEALRRVLTQVNANARYRQEPVGRDCWQTPDELRASGFGDCEDFAIAYWAALRSADIDARLVCVAFEQQSEAHMVCQAGDWTLDVLADTPYRMSERDDLVAIVYALGEADGKPMAWLNGSRPLHGFWRWTDVWTRIQADSEQEATP